MSEPLQPQQEIEVQGDVGAPLVLPVGNDGATGYVWTLELPEGVAEAGTTSDGRLRVAVGRAGSYVITATLADPGSATPMTVLLMRATVA